MDGTPYEAAVRLFAVAAAHWREIDGQAILKGVDLTVLPIDRFCNAIYAWAVERVEDREKFDYDLYAPVPGRVKATNVAQEKADFANFMGAVS